MRACAFPSLWSSLLAPETGEVGRNRAASAGWGPGGTVSSSLLHPLRLTCMRGGPAEALGLSHILQPGLREHPASQTSNDKVVLELRDCWGI